jgi:serine/threonine protein kinase
MSYGGVSLSKYASSCHELPLATIRSVMWQLLRALEYLHSCRVMHRHPPAPPPPVLRRAQGLEAGQRVD